MIEAVLRTAFKNAHVLLNRFWDLPCVDNYKHCIILL